MAITVVLDAWSFSGLLRIIIGTGCRRRLLALRSLQLLVELTFPFLGVICRSKVGGDLLRVHRQQDVVLILAFVLD